MHEFYFSADYEKAEKTEDGRCYIYGVASSLSKDKQNDAMTINALHKMADTAVGKPITRSHNNELLDQLGSVAEAKVDGDRLLIKGELDSTDPEAMRLFNKISNGAKCGFSVGGKITKLKPSLDKSTRYLIDDVYFDHLMATSKPVNGDTWAIAMHKAVDEIAESEDAMYLGKAQVTAEDREKYATYKENGVGKFPIFNEATAESALRLIGHAPADKQEAIRRKACSILGDSHPSCQPLNKGSNQMSTDNNELEKAGAKWSADDMAAIKDIHDGADQATQAKIRAMLGDDANSIIGELMEDAPDQVAQDSPSQDGDDFIGVIDKAITEKFDLMKSFFAEEIAKIASKPITPKGEVLVQKSDESLDPTQAYLSAQIGRYMR